MIIFFFASLSKAISVTAELPALCNAFHSIYQLFVHIILPCPYLCVSSYNTVQTTAKRVVRTLLNSVVCWSTKNFNHGLNYSKIHTLYQFCDFQYLLFRDGGHLLIPLIIVYKATWFFPECEENHLTGSMTVCS